MAQKVQVLDPGSYSTKRVIARAPILGFGVSGADERRNPSALEAKTRRGDITRGLQDLLPGKRLTGDAATLAMPAERVLHRNIEMPFSDRANLDNVLQFELESHVPLSADEMGFDYIIQQKEKNHSLLYVSVVHEKEIDDLRELLDSLQLDPRVVTDSGVALARLYDLMVEKPEGTVAFVDIGHRKTVVTGVKNGALMASRTTLTGGYDLTRGLAEHFDESFEEAEEEKHRAHLYPAGDGTAVGRIQEVADVLRESLTPLVRDLHQTFRKWEGVDRLFIFGGTARLLGLDQLLRQHLDVPVVRLFPSMLKGGLDSEEEGLQYVSAIATGYTGLRGGDAQRINFRRGKFAYEGDFKAIQGRLVYLAVMAIWFVILLGAPQLLRYRSLLDQKETLRSELMTISSQILDEELDDPDEILARLDTMPSAEVWSVFPDLTAHDIYWEVMDVVMRIDGQPTGETQVTPMPAPLVEGVDGAKKAEEEAEAAAFPQEIVTQIVHRLEVNSIRIDGASRSAGGEGVVEFTGNASSVATMELFLSRLSDHVCFHNVQRTKQEILKATPGKEGWWRFTVEFTVSCPKNSRDKKEEDESVETPAAGAPTEEDAEKEGVESQAPESEKAPLEAPQKGTAPVEPMKKEPAPKAGITSNRKGARPLDVRKPTIRSKPQPKVPKTFPARGPTGLREETGTVEKGIPDPALRDSDRGVEPEEKGASRTGRIQNRFLPKGTDLNRMQRGVRPLRPTLPSVNPNRLGTPPGEE